MLQLDAKQPEQVQKKKPTYMIVIIAGILALLTIFLSYTYFYFVQDDGGSYQACNGRLYDIWCALQKYAGDHNGHYPAQLSQLAPVYIKGIPTCPEAGYDTYSASYRVSTKPDAFSCCCRGTNHVSNTYKFNIFSVIRWTEKIPLNMPTDRPYMGTYTKIY